MFPEQQCFPIERNMLLAEGSVQVTLVDALRATEVPVVQTLAAKYLYNISVRKDSARAVCLVHTR